MKNLFNILMAVLLVSAVSCSSNSSQNSDSSDTSVSQNSSSTQAAADSNKKELEAKDSTELKADYDYAVTAANGGLLEVQLGKLAATKASSPKVIAFAKMMVTDHSKANAELMKIAGAKVITLPAILSNQYQKDYDDMSKLDKKDFDKAYTDYMVKDHKEDIEAFKKEVQDGKDTELKAFAAKHVPILEHHLQMAQQANDAVKK
jgi:putative membrane protein